LEHQRNADVVIVSTNGEVDRGNRRRSDDLLVVPNIDNLASAHHTGVNPSSQHWATPGQEEDVVDSEVERQARSFAAHVRHDGTFAISTPGGMTGRYAARRDMRRDRAQPDERQLRATTLAQSV
jgi:hypothetical protein